MKRRAVLLSVATVFVPLPALPAPLLPNRMWSGPRADSHPDSFFTGNVVGFMFGPGRVTASA